MSPENFSPFASVRRIRRTIFPLRVFGNSEIIAIFLSVIIGPISLRSDRLSFASNSDSLIFCKFLRTTKPKSASPVISSGIHTNAHSAINSSFATISSTSAIQILCPEIFTISSTLPVIKIYQSSS